MSKYVQLSIPFDFEEFRDIEDYQGLYQISNLGRVYSLKSNKLMKLNKNKKNYLIVSLHKDGKQKTYRVHRLVAQAFIPNPLHLPQVNHKDENPSNNHLENLEWCDNKYNCNYGSHNERIKQNPNYKATREKCGVPKKPVLQFDKQGDFVAEFPSISEAARQTKIDQCSISKCCLGRKYFKSAGGFIWRYKEEVA